MRPVPTLLIAGAAAVALTGVAAAQVARMHVLTVRLPGGGIEQIRYTGDSPPRVSIAPEIVVAPVLWPDGFVAGPFAVLDHVSAEMDRETAAMFRQAEALQAQALEAPSGLTQTGLGAPPSVAREYSFVSTVSGNGVCMRSVQITSAGPGQKPQVVRRASGDCGGANGSGPLNTSAPYAIAPAAASPAPLLHAVADRHLGPSGAPHAPAL